MNLKRLKLLVLPPRVRLKGRVERIQILEKGIIVKEYDGFDNLVLDSGLNLCATTLFASLSRYCAVGTGNTAPAVGQNLLNAEVARTGTMVIGAGNCGTNSPNAYTFEFKRTYDFPLGGLNGNYSELGFSPNSGANTTLFSRVLILVSGVPTAITVTSAQQLRVVYTLSLTFGPIVDTAFNLNFGGNFGVITGNAKMQKIGQQIATVDTSGLPYSAVSYTGLEPSGNAAFFVSPSATALAAVGSAVARAAGFTTNPVSPAAYVGGTFQRDKSVTLAVTEGNGAVQSFGIGMLGSGSYGEAGFVCLMDAPKNKLGTNTLTLNFRLTWGR